MGDGKKAEGRKEARSGRIGIRATERMLGQLAEVQRVLGARAGAPVSQGQAIAYAINFTLEAWAANPRQGRLI